MKETKPKGFAVSVNALDVYRRREFNEDAFVVIARSSRKPTLDDYERSNGDDSESYTPIRWCWKGGR